MHFYWCKRRKKSEVNQYYCTDVNWIKSCLLLVLLMWLKDGKCMKGWLDNEPLLWVKPQQKCGIYFLVWLSNKCINYLSLLYSSSITHWNFRLLLFQGSASYSLSYVLPPSPSLSSVCLNNWTYKSSELCPLLVFINHSRNFQWVMQVKFLFFYQTLLKCKVVNIKFFSREIWSSVSKFPPGIIILNIYC